MSGDPPHHPHNRPWNFIGIPNWRQPQHAHMAHKHSIIRQPGWHPPTTESMKVLGQLPHNFALHQMYENITLPPPPTPTNLQPLQPPPGVDLSLSAVGGGPQNGDATPASPISLSVKDAKRTTPLDASAPQPKCLKKTSSDTDEKVVKRTSPLDSVLERLKPSVVNTKEEIPEFSGKLDVPDNKSQDESSDSVPNSKEEETVSPYNTEDSLDSNKSRRKRKPNKTIRCSNKSDNETIANVEQNNVKTVDIDVNEETKELVIEQREPVVIERRRSSSLDMNVVPAKTRRKTSSESETIDNIAAMVQQGLNEKEKETNENDTSVPISVIKTKDDVISDICQESTVSESTTKTPIITPAQKKETHFVEIENKLEEMFAGIEDTEIKTDDEKIEETKLEDIKEESVVASTSQDNVTSTSNDVLTKTNVKQKKNKTKTTVNNKINVAVTEISKKISPKKSKIGKNTQIKKKLQQQKQKLDKDLYDSSSNASSAKSRGPFLHIKGPRSSPLSVNVVNTPTAHEEELEKKIKTKKFHDDSEYRHKVRSKGLHCSTLSNKYDAQTKDATWICVFCKKGPHTNDLSTESLKNSHPSGDLFGPYFITINCEEFERRLDDPYDRQFRSKKIARVLESTSSTSKTTKKTKRKLSENETETTLGDACLGIVETPNKTYEVWAHEECLVWSPGVYLVGAKIAGLQEAVWTSCNVACSRCGLSGANICCLRRGCARVSHVWCAQKDDWHFDEDCFKTFCREHRKVNG